MPKKRDTTIINPDATGYTVEDTTVPEFNTPENDQTGSMVIPELNTNRVDMAGTLLRALLANETEGGQSSLVSNNSYFQNLFQGNMSPVKRKRRSVPALERIHKFDSNREGNYNLVKVFTHYPTLEYPTASTFIQFTKGNSTVFMRINDLETLDNIAAFLTSVKIEIEALMPELRKMELTTQQKANEAEQSNLSQKMLIEQLLKGTMNNEED